MTTATELKSRILSKAAEDGDFRARLIADPKAAIASEIGTPIPDGFDWLQGTTPLCAPSPDTRMQGERLSASKAKGVGP